jgi:hypothetical protein
LSAALSRVGDLARMLADLPWFARCGQALAPSDVADARAWLAGLGLGPPPIEAVSGWRDASTLIQRHDWSRPWWDAETAASRALQDPAYARHGERACLAALADVTEAAAALRDWAQAALARAGLKDESLAKVAGGAAAQSCHQRGLAILANADESHAFAAKFRLFAAGRWPLGIVGSAGFVF